MTTNPYALAAGIAYLLVGLVVAGAYFARGPDAGRGRIPIPVIVGTALVWPVLAYLMWKYPEE